MLTGKYFYPFTVKQRWSICASWTSMILVDLSGVFKAGTRKGEVGFARGNGNFSSLLGDNEAGLQKLEWLQWSWDSAGCPALPILCSSGAVAAEHHSLPSVVCCGAVPSPRLSGLCALGLLSVMILICSLQSQGACLQPGRWFCQGLCFHTFCFGGLNRKHLTVCGCWVNHCGVTNVGILPSGYLLSHRCSVCIFYLKEHGLLY